MDSWFNNIFVLNGKPMTQKDFSAWHSKKVKGGPVGNHTLEILTPREYKERFPNKEIPQ